MYVANREPTTLDRSLRVATSEGQEIYLVYGVHDDGTCRCRKGPACPHPGKHPIGRNGIYDATSDPQEIEEMLAEAPDANAGLKTGKASGVVVLDRDTYGGGGQSLRLLEEVHGPLPSTLLHQSGGGDLHDFFRYPGHLDHLPSREIAPGLELKADGAGVVLHPSRHWTGGEYSVLIERPMAELPDWIVQMATSLTVHEGGKQEATESRFSLPERIVESSPSRNRTLFEYGSSLRAHGHEHAAILKELLRTNRERCIPPLPEKEVREVARSVVSRYGKGNASPVVPPEVLETVAYLIGKAADRPKKGTAAYSRWAVYRALLDRANRHGFLHADRDVAVSISVRDLALAAGVSKPTVLSALEGLYGSLLVYRVSHGAGAEAGVLALRAPAGRVPTFTTRTTPRVGEKRGSGTALYGLTHGHGLGKAKGDLLERVLEGDEEGIGRQELAESLKKRPESLKRWLKELVEVGLVERPRRGVYRAVKNWRRVLERERMMSGEKRSENLDRAEYERQRTAYRQHLAEKEGRR